MSRSFKTAAVAAVAMGIAGWVMAQGTPGERGRSMWGDGPGWSMGPGWHMGMGGGWRTGRGSDWMLDRMEGRLAFIKAELKITQAQSAAWNEFADVIRAAAKRHNERMTGIRAGSMRPKTLPERIEAQEQFMSGRVEEIKLIKTALNNLYAVLAEEQRREADEMDIPMVGMMGGPWG
jgi:hypothetical protein